MTTKSNSARTPGPKVGLHGLEMWQAIAKHRDALVAQNARLQVALEKLIESSQRHSQSLSFGSDIQKARAALQAVINKARDES